MAQSAKHLTLDFGSGHDLTVCGFEPQARLCADSTEPAWDCHPLPLSKYLNIKKKHKKQQQQKTIKKKVFTQKKKKAKVIPACVYTHSHTGALILTLTYLGHLPRGHAVWAIRSRDAPTFWNPPLTCAPRSPSLPQLVTAPCPAWVLQPGESPPDPLGTIRAG